MDREAIEALIRTAVAETSTAVQDTIHRAQGQTAVSPFGNPEKGIYAWGDPYRFAQPQSPNRRPDSQVTTQSLRAIADNYDILRSCIQHLKREVSRVPLEFTAKDEKDDSDATKAQIGAMEAFAAKNGGLGGIGQTRSEFEAELIEDICVIGAGAMFYTPTYGGGIADVVAIDASTIRPRVDAYGWPGPGEAAFEQWIMGAQIGGYTREQMDYRGLPICKRSYSPYYWSPVEWLIHVVNSALRADDWNRKWLTDGTGGSRILTLPESWTPDQVKDFALYWDQLRAGDTAKRQKDAFLPCGSDRLTELSRKDQEFQAYELWLLRRTCAIMGVQPASIGFAGEQYKVSQEDSMESGSWFGASSLLDYRKAFYDDLCERLGFGSIHAKNIEAREEKATERAERNAKLTGSGIKTLNEARKDEGLDPIDGGDELFLPSITVSLSQLVEGGQNADGNGDTPAGGDPVAANQDPASRARLAGDNGPAHRGARGQAGRVLRSALGQWERKCLNRVRAGKSADCEFVHPAIPVEIYNRIRRRLGDEDPMSGIIVRSVFESEAAEGLSPIGDISDWASRIAREIEAVGSVAA